MSLSLIISNDTSMRRVLAYMLSEKLERRKKIMKKKCCCICGRQFTPNARVKDRQKTCGRDECKRERHRIKCAEWNRNNSGYLKGLYLRKKLEAVSTKKPVLEDSPKPREVIQLERPKPTSQSDFVLEDSDPNALPKTRLNLRFPRMEIQEIIGGKALIVLEYMFHLLWVRLRDLIRPLSPI